MIIVQIFLRSKLGFMLQLLEMVPSSEALYFQIQLVPT